MIRHSFVTIKDIARTLDISVSTVSRALRDTHDVSKETREKVLSMAGQLKYKPNFNARGLVNQQSHNIAVILPFITNYYFSTVITGIQEVASSKGYNIILCVTNDSAEKELSILNNLSYSCLDGVLACVSSHSDSCPYFQDIIEKDIPVVFFDRIQTAINTSKVVQDDYNGAVEAVEHLIANGYRKIAHISGPRGFALTESRARGYRDVMKKHGLDIQDGWMMHSGFSQQDGESDMVKLYDLSERPDAIFAVNDRKAIGAMLALKKKNVRIGEEIGVIGFTDDPISGLISPGLSTIAEPALEIGKKSCELLIQHMTKKNFLPKQIVLPGRLVARESTRRSSHLLN